MRERAQPLVRAASPGRGPCRSAVVSPVAAQARIHAHGGDERRVALGHVPACADAEVTGGGSSPLSRPPVRLWWCAASCSYRRRAPQNSSLIGRFPAPLPWSAIWGRSSIAAWGRSGRSSSSPSASRWRRDRAGAAEEGRAGEHRPATATATATPSACKALDPPTAPRRRTSPTTRWTRPARGDGQGAAARRGRRPGRGPGGEADQQRAHASGSSSASRARTPRDYAASLVASAQTGGAGSKSGNGYAIMPLQSGQKVAVGVQGCDTVLISAQDPERRQVPGRARSSATELRRPRPSRRARPPAEQPVDPRVVARRDLLRGDLPELDLDRRRRPAVSRHASPIEFGEAVMGEEHDVGVRARPRARRARRPAAERRDAACAAPARPPPGGRGAAAARSRAAAARR